MHLAPKQILFNARINFKNELTNEQIVKTSARLKNIKKSKLKVDMIFLKTANLRDDG